LESTIEAADVALQEAKAADPSEINANQVKVNLAKISLSRQSLLEKTQATPEEKYDQANADYQLAQQQLALAQLSHRVADLKLKRSRATLEERIIRSPIDGVVTQRSLGPGEYVNQDGHILTVAQIDPLHVETFLPIRYFGHIHVGDTAMVRPDDPIGGERKGVVSVVDQVFDAASGTFGIRLNLPNPDRSVPGGLRCRVTFSVPEVDGAPAVR
jgi:RND family efflux transporter MFP subunit